MPKPPEKVKYAIQAVISLINALNKSPEWNDCKQIMRQDGFIARIMEFDKDSVTPKLKEMIYKNYIK